MRIVIALGGNAILKKGQRGTADEQRTNTIKTANAIKDILKRNEIVITHGNGPQVGNLMIQQYATKEVPSMPLDVCDAMTEGQIGYFLQTAFSKYTKKSIVAMLSRAIVDEDDSAFKNPTKPIGPFYKEKIEKNMVFDAGRGWRKVVPSPKIIEITGKRAIRKLLAEGFIVIAGGGGGIPIFRNGEGAEVVIDKDHFASFMADRINADMLLIITSIDSVRLNLGKQDEKAIKKMTLNEVKHFLKEGHFAEGSMKPKIEATIWFLEKKKGRKVIICGIDNARDALKGRSGTVITR